jgi:hypothetical protein
MTLDEYIQQHGNLTQFLLSLKLIAETGDTATVVEIIDTLFIDHLEYLEGDSRLETEFFLSAM